MRGRICWLGLLALLGACRFGVDDLALPGPDDDLAVVEDMALPEDLIGADLTGVDLSQTSGDLAGADLAMGPVDMAVPADLAMPPADLATPRDMAQVPDLGVAFPSHVPHALLDASSTDWTITNDTVVDTSQTTLAAAITPAPPPGVVYQIVGPFAVIAVRNLTVGNGANSYTRLTARGSRPLVIVAGGSIAVNGLIDAGAHGTQPGPGGAASSEGQRAGADGAPLPTNGTGGAGAGYGGGGGNGGNALHQNGNTVQGPAGAGTYGDAALTQLLGGSGGGNGVAAVGTVTVGCNTAVPGGGAGGGALQLSARVQISLASPHTFINNIGGAINVGGGGGRRGCGGSTRSGSGGGGGSGGGLLIEAPVLQLDGVLGASGGGGGGGGGIAAVIGQVNGGDGRDGLDFASLFNSSEGGAASTLGFTNGGGQGANRALSNGSVGAGGMQNGSLSSAGGGGGGFGRIRLRASGAPSFNTNFASPLPSTDTSVPAVIP